MTPLELLQDIIKIARIIYDQAQLVESNKARWGSLVKVIRQVVSALEGLHQLPRRRNFEDSLTVLHTQIQETNTFLSSMVKMGYMERFFKAGIHQGKIEEFRQAILEQLPILHLGLSAEVLIDREEDKQTELQDRQAFLAQEAEQLRQRQALLSRQRRDFDAMLKKQMQAFEDQLQKNWTPEPKKTKATLPAALTLPIYELTFEEKIHQSPTGDLYRGRWQNQAVLIKWVEGIVTKEDRHQFIREATLMSRLRHPSIVPFYGACVEPNRMCLVMASVDHRLVGQLMALSREARLGLLPALLTGLAYLHDQGICHGHIHPSTIGLNQDHAQWMDLSAIKTDILSLASLGIPQEPTVWQAPEIRGHREAVTPASDVYSIGCLLWALYTGESLTVLPDELGDCPYAVLIQACWSANPNDRPSLSAIHTAITRPSSPSGEEYYEQAREIETKGNAEQAFSYYERSAQKGYAKSLTRLGVFALERSTTDLHEIQAAKGYFERASQQGHALADYNLGRMYEKGMTPEGKKDTSTALFYYRQAQQRDPQERYQQKISSLQSPRK